MQAKLFIFRKAMILNKYFLALCLLISLITLSNAEIINLSMTSWENYHGPVNFTIEEGTQVNTTVFVLGHEETDQSIVFLDKDGLSLYTHTIASGSTYRINIVIIKNGFKTFHHGEEVEFHRADVSKVARVFINANGIFVATLTRNEPVWALEQLNENVMNYDFKPMGVYVPKTFNLTSFNAKGIQFGDSIVITGRMQDTKSFIIQLAGDGVQPLQMEWRKSGNPVLTMKTITDKDWNPQNLYRNVIDSKRFTIALVCEYQGWRIYFNGEDFDFYKHRWHPSYVKELKLIPAKGESAWKVKNVIHMHS